MESSSSISLTMGIEIVSAVKSMRTLSVAAFRDVNVLATNSSALIPSSVSGIIGSSRRLTTDSNIGGGGGDLFAAGIALLRPAESEN